MNDLTLTVLIPTFRRHERLGNCLSALMRQQRSPDQVIIVARPDDEKTLQTVEVWSKSLPIDLVEISIPGQVQAMNRGLEAVRGEIVCFTDDDTLPHPDWLQKIDQHFRSNSRLGGLGGRDIVTEHGGTVSPRDVRVGIISAFGRMYGNHHLGMGSARTVDFLKGANMSFRVAAIGNTHFDTDLRGGGAQVHQEIGFCLRVQNAGWALVYDPSVAVEHHPAVRHDSDQRGKPALEATENAAFNLYISLMRDLHPLWKRAVALSWARFIGTPSAPGVLRGASPRKLRDAVGSARRAATNRAWIEACHLRQRDKD